MFSKKGITLIETIIAILIFGIGIVTILSMISKNILVVDKVKNKSKATYLAKEGIEFVYNKRNTNLQKGVKWNCIELNPANYNCIKEFSSSNYLKADFSMTGYYNFSLTTSGYNDNILYYHTGIIRQSSGVPILSGSWYSHESSGGEKTIFSRYLSFSGAYLDGDSRVVSQDKFLKVSSSVLYKKGAHTGSVVLESFIGTR